MTNIILSYTILPEKKKIFIFQKLTETQGADLHVIKSKILIWNKMIS